VYDFLKDWDFELPLCNQRCLYELACHTEHFNISVYCYDYNGQPYNYGDVYKQSSCYSCTCGPDGQGTRCTRMVLCLEPVNAQNGNGAWNGPNTANNQGTNGNFIPNNPNNGATNGNINQDPFAPVINAANQVINPNSVNTWANNGNNRRVNNPHNANNWN